MDAPPVQYVTTSDGYNIAYAVSGSGPRTLLRAPGPLSNFQAQWRSRTLGPVLEDFAKRFRLVQYDPRGEGMSTRGLPEHLSLDHYELDLDAVMEKCCPEPVILYAMGPMGHVGVRYTVRKPERIAGLILIGTTIDDPLEGVRYLESAARASWDNILTIPAYNFYRLDPPADAQKILKSAMDPEDFSIQMRMAPTTLRPLLRSIKAPTLIIAFRGASGPSATGDEDGKVMASLIPGARLRVIDPEERIWDSIDEFVASLPLGTPAKGAVAGAVPARESSAILSSREVEVLRLLAAGKSNAQIADELVISQNTVIRHVSNIFAKIGAENRTEAASYAHRHHLT